MPRRYFTIVLVGACAALVSTVSPLTSKPAAAHNKHHFPTTLPSPTPSPSPTPTLSPTPTPTPVPSPTAAPSPTPTNAPPTPAQIPTLTLTGHLTWGPPACGDATHTCATYNVQNTGSHQWLPLDSAKDWIVKLPSVPVVGGIDIDNGHNVIIIGGEIDLTTPCTTDNNVCHGINISTNSTGEVYIEGVLIKNPDPTHSRFTGDGIDVNTDATSKITIQNVRVEGIDGCDANGFSAHADVFQPYHAAGAEIRVDHLTGATTLQGMEIPPDTATPKSGDYRNVNINVLPNSHTGCSGNSPRYGWWLAKGNNTCTSYPMSLTNAWLDEPNGSLASNAVWPDPANLMANCSQQYVGGVATWPSLPVVGGIHNGLPPGGDYVPLGVAGLNYVSPGYQ